MKRLFSLILCLTLVSVGFSQNAGEYDPTFSSTVSSDVKEMIDLEDSTILVRTDLGITILNYDGSLNSTLTTGTYQDMDTLSNGNVVLSSESTIELYDISGTLLWIASDDSTSSSAVHFYDKVVTYYKIAVDANDEILVLGYCDEEYMDFVDPSNDYLTTTPFIKRLSNLDGSDDVAFTEYNATTPDILCNMQVVDGDKVVFHNNSPDKLIKLSNDGSVDVSFTNVSTFNGNARGIDVLSDGTLVLIGEDVSNNVVVQRYNADGSSFIGFNPISLGVGIPKSVSSDDEDNILITGNFNTPYDNLVALKDTGSLDSSFYVGTGFDAEGKHIHYSEYIDAIYVGGAFSDYNGNSADNAVRLYGNNVLNADICYVTIDTNTFKSMVVWSKEPGLGIDYYIIHKEVTAGVYDSIGVNYFNDTLSQFVDSLSEPKAFVHRYRISAVDSSGIISTLSAANGTIRVRNLATTTGVVELDWNHPEGIGMPPSYTIYEVLLGGGLNAIATIPGSNITYTVVSPPTPTTQYLVGIDGVDDCGVSVFKASGLTTIFSNRIAEEDNTVSVNEESNTFEVRVYPNPATDYINIDCGVNGNSNFMIVDMSGRIVLDGQATNGNNKVDLSNLTNGVYNLVVMSGDKKSFNRFIKQ